MSSKHARLFTFFVSPYLFLTACNKSPVRPEAIDESPEAKSKGANLIVSDAKHSIPEILGKAFTTSTSGTRMLLVEPGVFSMGSPEHEQGRETIETLHEVNLTKHFWLGVNELTRLEWEKVMNPIEPSISNDTEVDEDKVSKDPFSDLTRPHYPKVQVSWVEAMEFCQKLTALESKAGKLPANYTYTLPTEAQWEFSCRAGTSTATAFGNSLGPGDASIDPQRPYGAVAKARIPKQLKRVGKYKPNSWGFYDMHGNAAEWCRDFFFARYPSGSITDPLYDKPTGLKVKRGGSYFLGGVSARSAKRGSDAPNRRSESLGFRIALVSN